MRTGVVLLMFAAGLLVPALGQAGDRTIETSDLIVSDATGRLPAGQFKDLADHAQETLNKVLAFWSAEPGTARFGKIRVVFDVPRRDVYSSVLYWEKKGDQRMRIVRVFGTEGAPQMLAHKLTSAVFPQKDKLIRNMMGILTEAQVGNPLTFPMCGFGCDEWVLAFLEMKSYIPLNELGPDHESWGMKDSGGGKLSILDKGKQHKAYAEAGSFADYLFQTHGVKKLKQLQRLSQEKERPWQNVFGFQMAELEGKWLNSIAKHKEVKEANIVILIKLLKANPDTTCSEAQHFVTKKR